MGKGLVPPIVVIGVVLGSIYGGITGITEAAGVGAAETGRRGGKDGALRMLKAPLGLRSLLSYLVHDLPGDLGPAARLWTTSATLVGPGSRQSVLGFVPTARLSARHLNGVLTARLGARR